MKSYDTHAMMHSDWISYQNMFLKNSFTFFSLTVYIKVQTDTCISLNLYNDANITISKVTETETKKKLKIKINCASHFFPP